MDETQAGGERADAVLDAVVEATCLTLREAATTEAAVRDFSRQTLAHTDEALTVLLWLSARSGDVCLVLSFPQETATTLAQRVLSEVSPSEPIDDVMIRDCVGELANVIGGQAKALLHGSPHHFTLATPTVLSGTGQPMPARLTGECRAASFLSDAGEFTLRLYFQ